MTLRYLSFAILPLLASCVAPPAPTPAPRPVPAAPAPRPRPAPVPTAPAADWSVADLTPGEWHYSRDANSATAQFAVGNGGALAAIRCASGQITIARSGIIPADIGALITIRTSAASRQLPIHTNYTDGWLTATLNARDPLFDQIIYSRAASFSTRRCNRC